jgi:hypothetical protein
MDNLQSPKPYHISTRSTDNNLGHLYADQGELKRREEIYTQVLKGKEMALGPDHTSTLDVLSYLGLLYAN